MPENRNAGHGWRLVARLAPLLTLVGVALVLSQVVLYSSGGPPVVSADDPRVPRGATPIGITGPPNNGLGSKPTVVVNQNPPKQSTVVINQGLTNQPTVVVNQGLTNPGNGPAKPATSNGLATPKTNSNGDDCEATGQVVHLNDDCPPPTKVPTSVPTRVPTTIPPTSTSIPPTSTSIPPTSTSIPPTSTSIPPTSTSTPVQATATSTSVPPTATSTTVPETIIVIPPPLVIVPPPVFIPGETIVPGFAPGFVPGTNFVPGGVLPPQTFVEQPPVQAQPGVVLPPQTFVEQQPPAQAQPGAALPPQAPISQAAPVQIGPTITALPSTGSGGDKGNDGLLYLGLALTFAGVLIFSVARVRLNRG
jgi:hypothetical protein